MKRLLVPVSLIVCFLAGMATCWTVSALSSITYEPLNSDDIEDVWVGRTGFPQP